MNAKSFLLSFCTVALIASSCDKSDDNHSDLTIGIAGHYTSASTSTDIVVNKIDDSKVSITLTTGSGSGRYSVAFSSVTMNSSNACTLTSVTQNGAGCIGQETFSGTGTYSGNNISLFMTVVGTNPNGPTPYDCNGTGTRNVSATKQ